MKKLIRNKHWYTEPFDYTDNTNISWSGEEKFWLGENDELIVRIARVYAVDEIAFTEQQKDKLSAIILDLINDASSGSGYFFKSVNEGFELRYSFEPVGIQIGGKLKLTDFEQWEQKWHELLESAEFPYRYEDNPEFSY